MRLIFLVIVLCGTAQAGVVDYVGDASQSGQGFGNTYTILTLQNGDTEEGSVAWDGTEDVAIGAVKNHTRTYSFLDLRDISGGFDNGFSLFANINEPDGWATLDNFKVSIFDADGNTLDESVFTGPLALGGTGQGSNDPIFRVSYDPVVWQSLFQDTNRIGASARFLDTGGGAESLSIGVAPAAVPEPGSLALLTLGLASLGAWRLKNRRSRDN